MLRGTLQDWYIRINTIYLDRNFYRSAESIFCHLIEVGRGLGIAASQTRKRNLNAEEFLPKTFAWWLALCGRVGIPNVEDLLWAKFPGVCPYCRLSRHQGDKCKEKREDKREIDWIALREIASQNTATRPRTLADWQIMFQQIYERSEHTSQQTNITRLSEEFGELAEAIRVFPVAPQFYLSEAPDVFAWLMGFANQFDYDRIGKAESLEQAMERNYPGACTSCGYPVCKCPPIPAETLGRIAREAPIGIVFPSHPGLFNSAEAAELFSGVEQALLVNGKMLSINKASIHQFAEDIKNILGELRKQGEFRALVSTHMAVTLGQLEVLSSQGSITQEAVQRLVEEIESLPTEERGALVGFLTSLSASALFQAVLMGAKALGQ